MKTQTAMASILVVLVISVSAWLLLYHLSVEPFQDYDEATYAEVVTEGLAAHQYISLSFLDQNYFNKPPLLFWLMDVSHALVPDAETAARLPSALSGLLLIAGLILLVYEASKNIYIGVLAATILAATSAFIEPARQVRFDILVSLFNMAAIYAFLRAMRGVGKERYWFLAFGAFIGLAILSKGPLAVYAVLAVLGIAIAYRRINWLWDPYFWGGVATCLVIAVPWHLYETIKFGYAFWEEYLGDQVIARVGQLLFSGPTNADYVAYLAGFASPWIELFGASVVAAPFLWRRMSVQVRALFLAAVVGALAVLAVCFISKTKAISYLIPLYPFIAVSIALVAGEIIREIARRKFMIISTVLAAVLTCLCICGIHYSAYNGLHLNPYYTQEVALADEEKAIGDTLHTNHAANFDVYNVTTLGSVMYYSRLVQPVWLATAAPTQGSYVLFNSNELEKFEMAYPSIRFSILYQGTYLGLGVVD